MADLDGDGDSEIVSATDTGQVFAFHLDGTMVQNFPISLGTAFIGSPIVKDVDGWRFRDFHRINSKHDCLRF